MNTSIQHQLLYQCRQNNRDAQLELYRRYCEAMFRIANRLLGNVQDAEDAVQDAFIKAFQKIEQCQDEAAFGGWLKKIVINRSLDVLNSKKKRIQLEQDIPIDLPYEEPNWDVEDAVSIEAIKTAIRALPDKYRRVLMLYLIEGYSHEELAQILDIKVMTSRSQLMRGRQKLQVLLKQVMGQP